MRGKERKKEKFEKEKNRKKNKNTKERTIYNTWLSGIEKRTEKKKLTINRIRKVGITSKLKERAGGSLNERECHMTRE